MRNATWNMIQSNPIAMRIWRAYRMLPESLREPLRWIAFPSWQMACTLVRRRSGNRVLTGPFKGMAMYLSPASNRQHLSYLLGTQELELHATINAIIDTPPATAINIGAADGYYAVGLARAMPAAHIIGFEALDEHRARFWQTAEANKVAKRISLRGLCMPADLQLALRSAGPRPLVFCDIEGGEKELLDNAAIPELNGAEILVETHDDMAPGCSDLLYRRFSRTHTIKSIYAQPRRLKDFPAQQLPFLAKWMPQTAIELMSERRTCVQEWLHLVPNSQENE